MAFLKKLKKGGTARWVIYNCNNNDYYTVPRGFFVSNMYVETLGVMTGTNNIAVGTVSGTFPIQTWTVAGTAGGTASAIVIDGVSTISIANGQTAAQIAATIMATAFSYTGTTSAETWALSLSGLVITAIGNVPKAVSAVTISYGTVTGVTVTAAQVAAGSVCTSGATVVTATAVSNYPADYSGQTPMVSLTQASPLTYGVTPATQTPYLNLTATFTSGTVTGTFIINGTTFTPSQTAMTSAATMAQYMTAAINATTNQTGLFAYQVGATAQFFVGVKALAYSYTATATMTYNFGGLSTGAGVTVTTNYPADPSYYINFSTVPPAGNVNVYVELQRLN